MKKVLLLGGTGAMGVYLIPELLTMGYKVDVISLDDCVSNNPNLNYFKINALDNEALSEVLKEEYNGIVDFLIYTDPENTFKKRKDMLINNTDHYIFLSTYRIYADKDAITTEDSPRLLDVATNKDFLSMATTEYSLYKAMSENMLHESKQNNWTIIRPAITYSKRRFQLVTLEANVLVDRMRKGKTVVLPKDAMDIQATMSWAGDVAKMIARLLFNEKTFRETYTVATSEHNSWREIADIYKEIGGLKYETTDVDSYIGFLGGSKNALWQLKYDRLFNRVINNNKILNITGLKQSELMPLYDGLKFELSNLPKDFEWQHTVINDLMDRYLESKNCSL